MREPLIPSGRLTGIVSVLLAVLVAVPLLLIFSAWLQPQNEIWQHLVNTLLADLVINTLWLVIGVGSGVMILGIGLAWLTSMCEFPGRRFFEWALMLPLAIPAYVLAFVALGLLEFAGPVQTAMRELIGSKDYWFPDIRSAGGVIAVMVLVLYPYVYMLVRAAFLTQGSSSMEAARVLGLGPWAAFFRVTLPMARPAAVAGTSLALMETLADFGTVAVFNFDTFTTAIYKAWYGLFSLQAASQLASLLLLFVLLALFSERRLRGRARYDEDSRSKRPQRLRLHGGHAWFASLAAGFVFVLAFVVPVAQLLTWAWKIIPIEFDERYLGLIMNTLLLGTLAAFLTVSGALMLGLNHRRQRTRFSGATARLATLGYALPGSVLAVGTMLVFTALDNVINELSELLIGSSPGRILGGTVLILLMAYMVRFLAVAFGPIEGGLERIRPHLAESARSLGASSGEVVRRIYLPLLRPGLLTAALLVLVDVMKEMPATLLLRPFGWDTLATRIYGLTAEGQWERAALPAVTLVLVGLCPVVLLIRRSLVVGTSHRPNPVQEINPRRIVRAMLARLMVVASPRQ